MIWLAIAAAFLLPLVLVALTRQQLALSWTKSSLLWLIAAVSVVLVLSELSLDDAIQRFGIGAFSGRSLLVALATVLALAVGSAVALLAQRAMGLPLGDRAGYERVVQAKLPLRVFVVCTAGVVEEVLYRGIGIGIGGLALGDAKLAAVLSMAAFTAAHFRWQASHLVQVAVAGGVLSLTFVLTNDLWACILAHILVDALGFIVAPALRRRAAKA